MGVTFERQSMLPWFNWPLCPIDDLKSEISVVEKYLDTIRTAEVPMIAWPSGLRSKDRKRDLADSSGILFLVVDARESLVELVAKAFSDRRSYVRRLDPENFARLSISDELLDQFERDMWQRKISKIVTIVSGEISDVNDMDGARLLWRNYVNSFYNRSSLFQSYASRGDISHGLVHFDPRSLSFEIDLEHATTHQGSEDQRTHTFGLQECFS